jgi:ribosomal protein S27AE
VESDTGKVKRLKKDCLNCGAGVRMAVHYDRYYCGKCALTVRPHAHSCRPFITIDATFTVGPSMACTALLCELCGAAGVLIACLRCVVLHLQYIFKKEGETA